MFVGEEHTIEPFGSEVALLEPDDDLPRAQSAIDQDPAMVGRNESAVAGAAAAEHGEAEHEERLAKHNCLHKRNRTDERFSIRSCGQAGKGIRPSSPTADCTTSGRPQPPRSISANTCAFLPP